MAGADDQLALVDSSAVLDREPLRRQFGRIGTAADNAAMEAFWSTLKPELRFLHRRRVWPDRASLRAALLDYIAPKTPCPSNGVSCLQLCGSVRTCAGAAGLGHFGPWPCR
jgi:hypothetical protein